MNEEAVGAAIREAIETGMVTRNELFITTKLWTSDGWVIIMLMPSIVILQG